MWTDARAATAYGFWWLLLVTAGFLFLPRPGNGTNRLQFLSLPLILLIAALVRILPAFWLPVGAGYDIESFKLVTDALLSGREVYTTVLGRHPYLPFQMYIMSAMAALAPATGLPYVVAIKLPSILGDIALTALIYRAILKRDRRVEMAAFLATLYALNPVSLLVTSYHGQFEAVTLFLLALAWYFWEFGPRIRASATSLGLAILNKTWPVVFLPIALIRLRDRRAQLAYLLLAVGIPVVAVITYLIVFNADPLPMLRRALTHRGVAGYWGPGAVLFPAADHLPVLQPLVNLLLQLKNWLLLGGLLFGLWFTRSQTALDALLTLLLTLFVLTVGFGIQWLVWLVPFALLAGEDRWGKIYSLAAAFMLVIHLYGLHLYPWLGEWLTNPNLEWVIRLSALPAWVIALIWLIQRLRLASAQGTTAIWATEEG
jgi:hypothetical protein